MTTDSISAIGWPMQYIDIFEIDINENSKDTQKLLISHYICNYLRQEVM
jgi:hypothetical protein